MVRHLNEMLPGGIIRPGPSMPGVVHVADGIKCLLPSGRREVEALAGRQINASGEDVDVTSTISLTMQDGRIGGAIFADSSKCHALEVIQDCIDLCIGRRVVLMECDHARHIAMLEFQTVGNNTDLNRIATQHLNIGALDAVVVFIGQQVTGGTLPATGAVSKELNVHCGRPQLPARRCASLRSLRGSREEKERLKAFR